MKKFILSFVVFLSLFICNAEIKALPKEAFGDSCVSAWHCDTKSELIHLTEDYKINYFQPVDVGSSDLSGYYVEFVEPAYDPTLRATFYGFVIEVKKPISKGYFLTR